MGSEMCIRDRHSPLSQNNKTGNYPKDVYKGGKAAKITNHLGHHGFDSWRRDRPVNSHRPRLNLNVCRASFYNQSSSMPTNQGRDGHEAGDETGTSHKHSRSMWRSRRRHRPHSSRESDTWANLPSNSLSSSETGSYPGEAIDCRRAESGAVGAPSAEPKSKCKKKQKLPNAVSRALSLIHI